MLICYKTSLDASTPENNATSFERSIITSGEGNTNYENVISQNGLTPDAKKR